MEEFPPEIVRCLEAYLLGVEHVEVVRFLHAQSSQSFTAQELSQKLGIAQDKIANTLAFLGTQGVLGVNPSLVPGYRYGPSTAALEDMLQKVIRLYQERPVTLINWIYARAQAREKKAAQAFADAFRLGKDK